MSLIGNIVRELTKTVSNVGEAVINGATDVTETVTGRNSLTQAVRETGVGVVLGAKAVTDAVVDLGEDILGIGAKKQAGPQDEPNNQEG